MGGDVTAETEAGERHIQQPRALQAVLDAALDLIMAMVIGGDTVVKNVVMKVQQSHVDHLFARTVLAQEEERKRISSDLHDGVAQWLVGASYQLQTCRAMLANWGNGEAQRELAEIEDSIDRSLKEMRRVISGLHPPVLEEFGLVHSLCQLLEGLKPYGIDCHSESEGEPVRLPASAELMIYRVVQEAMNNVRKHSGASAVVLRLRFDPMGVRVEVSDNGRGFDLAGTTKGAVADGRLGLLGMSERALMVGGNLRIRTRRGNGTRVILTLPLF